MPGFVYVRGIDEPGANSLRNWIAYAKKVGIEWDVSLRGYNIGAHADIVHLLRYPGPDRIRHNRQQRISHGIGDRVLSLSAGVFAAPANTAQNKGLRAFPIIHAFPRAALLTAALRFRLTCL